MKNIKRKSRLPIYVLSTTVLASTFASIGMPSHAQSVKDATVTNTTPVTADGFIRPDAPITLSVQADQTLKNNVYEDGNSGKGKIGVLLTDGTDSVLATQDNGLLEVSLDGDTMNLTVHHDGLNRYTSYSANLLTGSTFNKYEAQVKSNGHAQSFANVSKDAVSSVSLETGSAIGEATHVSATVDKGSVRVTDGGTLKVKATDDYQDPATNATVTVSGSGLGNARVASAFVAPEKVSITSGEADIPLADHSAENVTLNYSVQDNTYQDSVDTKAGTSDETFIPGVTAQIHVNQAKSVAGKTVHITGDAEDVYNNSVMDGTAVSEQATGGSIQNATATSNGKFGFDYVAPTKAGAYGLTVGGDDYVYAMNNAITVVHDVANKAIISVPSNLQVGQTATIAGTVQDKYGNAVDNAPVALTGALTGTATTNVNGQFSMSAKVVQSGTVSANVGGQAISLQNANGQAITTISATKKVVASSPWTISMGISSNGYYFHFNEPFTVFGTVYDYSHNPCPNAHVRINIYTLTYSVYTDANGNYSLTTSFPTWVGQGYRDIDAYLDYPTGGSPWSVMGNRYVY